MNKAELIELDANGEELELIAEGSFARMSELMQEVIQEREDDGEPWPRLMVQAA